MSVTAATPTLSPARGFTPRNMVITMLGVILIDGAFYGTMPLLPAFLRQLGVFEPSHIASWTGILMGVTPAIAAAVGPLWGNIGDRTGLRLMALRTTFVLAAVWVALAFSANVSHVLALRIVLGLLCGFQTIVMALATAGSGANAGQVIARIQITQIATAAVSPAVGGYLSVFTDIRSLFIGCGILCFVAALLFAAFYRDVRVAPPHADDDAPPGERASLIRWLALLLFLQMMIDRSFQPAATLWALQHSHSAGDAARIAGLILSLGALGDGLAAWVFGGLRTSSARRVLLLRSLAGSAVCIALGLVVTVEGILAFRLLLSLLAAGGLTIFYSLASRIVPERRRSSDFSFLASCAHFGQAAGQTAAGLLAARHISYVFYMDAILFGILAVLVQRLFASGRLKRGLA